jgi:hypothetical protein
MPGPAWLRLCGPYVQPLLTEAGRLGIGFDELFALIEGAGREREGASR